MNWASCVGTLLSVVAGCGAAPAAVGTAALGGGEPTSAFPSVVGVALAQSACGIPFSPQCTGILIAPRVVLTAAHCLLTPDSVLDVAFGSGTGAPMPLRGSGRAHPAYDPTTHADDFAVIVLEADAPAAPLPLGLAPSLGASVTMVGFGLTELGTTADGLARSGTGTIAGVSSHELRIDPAPAVSCVGDSGGPVLFDGAVVGVISWGDSACMAFTAAERTDVDLDAFLAPVLADTAASAAVQRKPLAEGTSLCDVACASDADCPLGTSCVPGSDGSTCQLPGFGAGVVGGSCANGAGCACVRTGDDECRCLRPCARPGGCSAVPGCDGAWWTLLLLVAFRRRHRN